MTKIAGSGSESGSISQRHGSVDPDPDLHQNVMDPEHCICGGIFLFHKKTLASVQTKCQCYLNPSPPPYLDEL